MRTSRRRLTGGALLGALAMLALVGVSPAAAVTIKAAYPNWNPNTATISSGESVSFENTEMLSHGIGWQAGAPATPSCTGVPGPAQAGTWSGSCTFTVAGSYQFFCTLHSFMTGTITVTGPQAPTVATTAATVTGDTEATVNGTVDPNEQSTDYFFKYGTTTGYGQETGPVSAGSGSSAVPASVELTGLAPKTTYHFRLFATNDTGTSQGQDKTFTTSGSPTATTSGTSGLGDTEATLLGTVNPFGHATTYFFKWGETASYGDTTGVVSAGNGFNAVPAVTGLTGLTPETEYHFRLVAENGLSQKSEGVDKAFTTTSTPPPPPQSEPLPTPAIPALTAPPPADKGPALGSAVKVIAGKKGAPVRGSVEVLPAGAGGKLVVEMRGKGVGLAGRFTKAGVAVGKVPFAVRPNPKAKRALKGKGRLPVTLKITLTPPGGSRISVTKSVVLTG